MNIIKKLSISAISISLLALQGCSLYQVTAETDQSKSVYQSDIQVDSNHKLFKGLEVETQDFEGTSHWSMSGRVSPNLSNETAKVAIEQSLDSANLLASSHAKYLLSAKMVEDGAYNFASRAGSTFTGTDRDIKIAYSLSSLDNTLVLYNEVIASHGEASFSDAKMWFYLQEKVASERSYQDSFKKLVNDLIAIQ